MKLMSQVEARSRKKRENDALVDSNLRLKGYYNTISKKLSTIKEDYDPDKLQKLAEFERFCKDIELQRTKLLQELAGIQKLVADTKEIYYGLITKQDELFEKQYKIEEENKKLDLREAFVTDLEKKWQAKQ